MYNQLTSEQRSQITALLTTKINNKEIANILGVHISTIYREIKRNGNPRSYNWETAQKKTLWFTYCTYWYTFIGTPRN